MWIFHLFIFFRIYLFIWGRVIACNTTVDIQISNSTSPLLLRLPKSPPRKTKP